MPKMKLPDKWQWEGGGIAQRRPGYGVFMCDGDLITEKDIGIETIEVETNYAVALAVIRSANLDPVYEAAKALFFEDGCISTTKAHELLKLIASLEDPE